MTHLEHELVTLIAWLPDNNLKAVALQTYIQKKGPLSEEAAVEIRRLLSTEKGDGGRSS